MRIARSAPNGACRPAAASKMTSPSRFRPVFVDQNRAISSAVRIGDIGGSKPVIMIAGNNSSTNAAPLIAIVF